VRDGVWIADVRRAAAGPSGWPSRRRQLADFLRFGLRSGHRFARFGVELLATR
jgi:hypothetical protein